MAFFTSDLIQHILQAERAGIIRATTFSSNTGIGVNEMQTSFAMGTVYDHSGEEILAEVHYYIQSAPPGDCITVSRGFIEPILGYERLSDVVTGNSKMVLETADGRRLMIMVEEPKEAASGALQLFFRTEAKKRPARAGTTRNKRNRANPKMMQQCRI